MSNSNNKISRSIRLRKYRVVYESCIKKNLTTYKKSPDNISDENSNIKTTKRKKQKK